VNLDDLRKQIDELDTLIVNLIAERMKVTREIGLEKQQTGRAVEDKSREKEVLERVRSQALAAHLSPDEVENIYLRIIAASKEAQASTVAFQGELGAYSEEAALQYFGAAARLQPCETLEEVFQLVEKGRVQYGLVPVENSLEGSVTRTYDLLLDSNAKVNGETELRIVHCLIGLPDATIDSVKEVYSHPQALGQCKNFILKMGWKPNATYDTAGSVKLIKDGRSLDRAAIASARAAEIYGMKILLKGIEDNNQNFTRFFVLSRTEMAVTGNDKTSIVFTVKHKPGALYEALKELADKRLNLTKIESRPTRQKPWEYNFYVDVDGHQTDSNVRTAIQTLQDSTVFVKILGSYPRMK
jgi:chorismate mutase / prephenate dehydratase